MKLSKHLLLLSIFFFPSIINAQIPTKGHIILGDSSQQHVVSTLNGDKFTGRVTSLDAEKMTFQYRGNELVFPISEIQLVEVLGSETNEQAPLEPHPKEDNQKMTREEGKSYIWHFDYRITNSRGIEHLGKMTKFNEFGATIDGSNAKSRFVPYKEVKTIERLGKKITENPNELNEYQRLITAAGNSFIGQLLSFDGEIFEFLLKNGSVIKYPKNEVSVIQIENSPGFSANKNRKKVHVGKQYYYNPQRVFFSPSAFTLEKGVTEFRNTMVLHNTIDYGVSENLTIGAGLSTVLVANAVSGKVKFGGSLTDHFHIAAGVQGLVLLPAFGEDAQTIALLYGAISVGTKDKFLSISVGMGRNDYDNENTAGITIGGSMRTSENWRIYMEYIYFDPVEAEDYFYRNSNTSMGTLGMSWFRDVHQIDFGLHTNSQWGYETIIVLPIAAYSLRF